MPSRFFKYRLAAVKKLDAKRARLLLSGATQTPKGAMYSLDPTKDTLTAEGNLVLDSFSAFAAFSPDGNFLAVTSGNAPWATLFRFDPVEQKYVKHTDSDVNATYITASNWDKGSISFTADGSLMVITHSNRYFVVFRRSADGSTYRHLFTPTAALGGVVAAISPDGSVIAVRNSGDRVYMFKRTADAVWTYSTYIDINLPSGEFKQFKWYDNTTLFALSSNEFYAINAFKWDGTTITRVTSVRHREAGGSLDINYAADHVAIGGGFASSPWCAIFKWNPVTNTFTSIRTFGTPDVVNGVSFSPDGVYFAFGHAQNIAGGAVKLKLYRRLGDSYTEIPNAIASDTISSGVAPYFSPAV